MWDTGARKVTATVPYTYDSQAATTGDTPFMSKDGKTVEVLDYKATNVALGPPLLWSVATSANITSHDSRWQDDGVALFSPDGQVCATDRTGTGVTSAETVELWDVATRSLLVSVGNSAVYGGDVWAVGPHGHELLTEIRVNNRNQLDIWDIA